MGVLFAILMMVFFWWAVITGFKTLARRFFDMLGGMFGGGADRSYGEARHWSQAADDYQPASVDTITSDMEAALAHERASAADLLGQSTERHSLLRDAERLVSEWDDKARRAVKSGRDDLARSALSERMKASAWADSLRTEISRIDDLLRGYQADIQGLQTRLGEVYRRRSMASSRIDRAQNGAVAYDLLNGPKWEEAQPDFASMDRRADFEEARLEAMRLGAPPAFGRRAPANVTALSAPSNGTLTPISTSAPSALDRELEAMKARLAAVPSATASPPTS